MLLVDAMEDPCEPRMMDRPTYSIVIPVYDEEESLPELFERLRRLMEQLDGPAEVIFVDDGSRDRSPELLTAAARGDRRFKVARFSRNFGHQVAITAGVDLAAGDAVVIMDADLQDPPEVIPEMAARWREGYQVVYAVRDQREGESLFKRGTARVFYRLMSRLSDADMPVDSGDFKLVDRRAVDAFKMMRERSRYVRGMFSWVGFEQTGVRYKRAPRYAGKTKYPLWKMVRFALDGMVSFSNLPLRLTLNLGFILSGLSLLLGLAAIVTKLTGASLIVPGWASIAVALSFFAGVQLIVLGVMGEYVARIYDEVKNRPLYLFSELHGFGSEAAGDATRTGVSETTVEVAVEAQPREDVT